MLTTALVKEGMEEANIEGRTNGQYTARQWVMCWRSVGEETGLRKAILETQAAIGACFGGSWFARGREGREVDDVLAELGRVVEALDDGVAVAARARVSGARHR